MFKELQKNLLEELDSKVQIWKFEDLKIENLKIENLINFGLLKSHLIGYINISFFVHIESRLKKIKIWSIYPSIYL